MDPPAADGWPLYTVTNFTFCDHDTDTEFTVMCNGKRLFIRLSADNFSESPPLKDKYLFFLEVADEFELEGHTVDDFYDWVVKPFLPILRAIPPLDQGAKPTLHDFFFPETTDYTLSVVAGELTPRLYEPGEDDDEWAEDGVPLPEDLCSPWPSFRLSEIEICPRWPGGALSTSPTKVQLADGTTAWFKSTRAGDSRRAEQEIRNYEKIKDAGLEDGLRISRLHGLARDDDGLVFGLLLGYIDGGGRTLASTANPDAPLAERRKWAEQVKYTVERLHEAGVVWGDAKAENVLVDDDEDAWVIDFGGGYTEGWVEKDYAGTVTDDLQGLAKILEFLDI